MIEYTESEIKADVFQVVSATADTAAEITSNADSLKGSLVACREDQFIYFVCLDATVTKTNLRSREVI